MLVIPYFRKIEYQKTRKRKSYVKLLIPSMSVHKSKSIFNSANIFFVRSLKTYLTIKNSILAIYRIFELRILKITNIVRHQIFSKTSMNNNMKMQTKTPFKTLISCSYEVFINSNILSFFQKSQKI